MTARFLLLNTGAELSIGVSEAIFSETLIKGDTLECDGGTKVSPALGRCSLVGGDKKSCSYDIISIKPVPVNFDIEKTSLVGDAIIL